MGLASSGLVEYPRLKRDAAVNSLVLNAFTGAELFSSSAKKRLLIKLIIKGKRSYFIAMTLACSDTFSLCLVWTFQEALHLHQFCCNRCRSLSNRIRGYNDCVLPHLCKVFYTKCFAFYYHSNPFFIMLQGRKSHSRDTAESCW